MEDRLAKMQAKTINTQINRQVGKNLVIKLKQIGGSYYCIFLVRMKWAPTRQRPFGTTKEYIWHQNKDYMGGATG